MGKFSVILVAAGQSARFGDPHLKKPFVLLDGKAVWLHSVDRFLKHPQIGSIVIVIAPEDREAFLSKFAANLAVLGIELAAGGPTRSASVRNGLAQLPDDCQTVAVHDAARPCFGDGLLNRLVAAAERQRNVIPAIRVDSTLKRSGDGRTVESTVDREHLWLAQTPQFFDGRQLRDAFARFPEESFTDEAQLLERAGHSVYLVEGSPLNVKLTTREDLDLARALVKLPTAVRFDAKPNPLSDDLLWR